MKIYIKTYGCQMNERDSEACSGMLVARGHSLAATEKEADVLIYNTCSVRDQAERKAIGKVGIMKRLKRKKPDIIIGIMGCMAQNHGEKLLKELPHVDFIIGTGQLHKVPDIIEELSNERIKHVLITESPDVLDEMGTHYAIDNNQIFAQVAITRGCNRFCSYCIVPYVRGREISRKITDIVNEVNELVKNGVKEILLLGQNVAAFGLGGDINPPAADVSPFADLLTELNEIKGLERIRFTSPYPSYFTDKLINAIVTLPKVCNNIQLPLQSGSDRILKKMNRQYTAEQYLEIINKLKKSIPEVTFATDVIVGFPEETDEDFSATRDLLNEVGFVNAYLFKYSPRQGTPAAEMPDQVPQEIKESRHRLLLDDLKERTIAHNKTFVNTTQQILVEGPSKRNSERWTGKTTNGKHVMFTWQEGIKPGSIIKVDIKHCSTASLFGDIVE
jgi:tRNA-2-methylthio-N6-dimethylallyladenosine synthase